MNLLLTFQGTRWLKKGIHSCFLCPKITQKMAKNHPLNEVKWGLNC